tara:strand:- start:683 stop:862 length:180 start_codon:yes stop_codon:yes gene_type:complete
MNEIAGKKIDKFPPTDAQKRLKIVFNTLEIKQLQVQIDQLIFENSIYESSMQSSKKVSS